MQRAMPIMLAAAMLAAPAEAEGPERPAPGCAGINFEDPRGDVGNPGLDIVSGFLTHDAGGVSANFVVANLDRRVDDAGMAEEYFVAGWTAGDRHGRAEAHLLADGTVEGARFFEGENGVVQMPLAGVAPGTPIKLWAYSGADREPVTAPGPVYAAAYLLGEKAEEIEGREQAAACAAPAPAAPAAEPPAPSRAAPAPSLELLAARAAGRRIRVTLRSSGARDVRARLLRGRRVVAAGRLDRLQGTATLTLVARRALRRGAYTLRISGLAPRTLRVR